jgi:DNA-binding NarL/FixJ family response regulator
LRLGIIHGPAQAVAIAANVPGRPSLLKGTVVDRISAILADDHADFLAMAERILEPEVNVLQIVNDGSAAVGETLRLKPDVVVLDISMPVLNGIEAARQLRTAGCQAKIVFLTVHHDADFARAALEAGAMGYVVKDRLANDLMLALREAMAGRCFVSPCIDLAPVG